MVETSYPDSAISLREHVGALWRRRRLVMGILAVAVTIGVVATQMTQPVYESSARL